MDGSPQTTTRDYNPAEDPRFLAVGRKLFVEEGDRFTCDPSDPGGATKYGVSLRYLVALGQLDRHWIDYFDADHDGRLTAADIARITPAQALDLYGAEFWVKTGFFRLPTPFDAAVFDEAVNAGPSVAVTLFQKALRTSGETVVVDGAFGGETLAAVKRELVDGRPDLLLANFRAEVEARDRALVQQNPHLAKYLNGWVARARGLGSV